MPTERRNAVTTRPSVPKLRYKPSPSKQLALLFGRMRSLLLSEWPSIRSMNLGVKSGTGVIEDVLLIQLQHLTAQLHTLAVSDAGAADTLLALTAKMNEQQFQQLQVLLDVLGHEELSDYLRLITTTAHIGTAAATDATSCCSRSGSGTLSARQFQGASSAGSQLLDSAVGAAGSSWQGRSRAAAGRLDLVSLDLLGPGAIGSFGRSSSFGSSCGSRLHNSLPDLNKGLRFAALLPPGHILTKTAEDLQRQYEFQGALQAAAAATQRGPRGKQQQQQVPRLQLPSRQQTIKHAALHDYLQQQGSPSGLSGPSGNGSAAAAAAAAADTHHSCSSHGVAVTQQRLPDNRLDNDNFFSSFSGAVGAGRGRQLMMMQQGCLSAEGGEEAAHPFTAPSKDIEELWKQGRRATTQAVLDQAHLLLHESPLSNTLMLAATVPVVPKHLPPASTEASAGAAAAAAGGAGGLRSGTASRRATGSRPASARRFSRISSCALDVAVTAAGAADSVAGAAAASVTGRLTSGVVSSAASTCAWSSGPGRVSASWQQSLSGIMPAQLRHSQQQHKQQQQHGVLLEGLPEDDAVSHAGEGSAGRRIPGAMSVTVLDSLAALDSRPTSAAAAAPIWLQHQTQQQQQQQQQCTGLSMAASSSTCCGGTAAGGGAHVSPAAARRISITAAGLTSSAAAPQSVLGGGLCSRPSSAGSAVPPLQLSRLGSMHSLGNYTANGPASYRPSSAGSTCRSVSPGPPQTSRPGSAMSTSRLATATAAR